MRRPDLVNLLWEPRDLWVGVYWTRKTARVEPYEAWEYLEVYVCVLPCLPIRMTWCWAVREGTR